MITSDDNNFSIIGDTDHSDCHSADWWALYWPLIINMINGIPALISHHNLFIRLDNDKFCLNEQLLMNEPRVSCHKMDEELAIWLTPLQQLFAFIMVSNQSYLEQCHSSSLWRSIKLSKKRSDYDEPQPWQGTLPSNSLLPRQRYHLYGALWLKHWIIFVEIYDKISLCDGC